MNAFEEVAENHPTCEKADDAWYMAGRLGILAYENGGNHADLSRALHAFQTLIQRYPASHLADDAHFFSGEIYLLLEQPDQARQEFKKVLDCQHTDMAEKAISRLRELDSTKNKKNAEKKPENGFSPGPAPPPPPAKTKSSSPPPKNTPPSPAPPNSSVPNPSPNIKTPADNPAPKNWEENLSDFPISARLISLRSWSNRDYTRVVIDLDQEVPYQPPHLLKPDPELGTPPRLYIDFNGAALAPSFREKFPFDGSCYTLLIADGFLRKVRAGQYAPNIVRVVLDIERIDHFRAFPLPGSPFRYVIDVYGTVGRGTGGDDPAPSPPAPENAGPSPPPSEPQPLPGDQTLPVHHSEGSPPKKIIIVLDPGHGGKDPGAIGPSGVKEKDITLAVALKTKNLLEKERPDLQIVLTRQNDQFLGLVDRTAMANTLGADLFISIHCNASPNSAARGVETYYLDNTTDRANLALAAKENFVPEAVMEDSRDTTNLILADLITASKVEASVPLAATIQRSLVRILRERYPDVVDHGVKKAPFWVLTGAIMPCALVETSFISNPDEEKRLRLPQYQDLLAQAIGRGIIAYLKSQPVNHLAE